MVYPSNSTFTIQDVTGRSWADRIGECLAKHLRYAGLVTRSPRRRALLVACSYPEVPDDREDPDFDPRLANSWKDVINLQRLLIDVFGWNEEEIVILRDGGDAEHPVPDQRFRPTKKNMLRRMKELVRGAQCGDLLFFHFSGHGDQVEAKNDPFEDNDQIMLPTDYLEIQRVIRAKHERSKAGGQPSYDRAFILDDDIRKILVDPLPTGCILLAAIDACHSGTMMDLPFPRKTSLLNTMPMDIEQISEDACGSSTSLDSETLGGRAAAPAGSFVIVRGPKMPFRTKFHSFPIALSTKQRVPSNAFMAMTQQASLGVIGQQSATPRGAGCWSLIRRKCAQAQIDKRIIRGTVMCVSSCADDMSGFESDQGGVLVQAFCTIFNGTKKPMTLKELKIQLSERMMEIHKKATKDSSLPAPMPQIAHSHEAVSDSIYSLSLELQTNGMIHGQ